MIKLEKTKVMNFEGALRGMRNPLESWDKSDSTFLTPKDIGGETCETWDRPICSIGENDQKLALQLATAGSDHGKFLRQLFVSVDITSNMSFFWDFDTYGVGVVKNSTSRMHKLGTRFLFDSDFDWDDTDEIEYRNSTLARLNLLIAEYQSESDKTKKSILFRKLFKRLPPAFLFTRTWTGNYENLRNIYFNRKGHKQKEFDEFRKWIESLPFSYLITTPRTTPNERKLMKENEALKDAIRQTKAFIESTYPEECADEAFRAFDKLEMDGIKVFED